MNHSVRTSIYSYRFSSSLIITSKSTWTMCTSYSIDFTFLKEIKAYIENEIHNDQRNLPEEVVMSSLPDGRLIRTVYPQGYAAVERNPDKTLHFVGFIGFIKPTENLEPMLRERMWQIDNELMKELKDHPDIVAYSSAERVAGCDWANLVLFTCEEAIQKWRDSQLHWTAVL